LALGALKKRKTGVGKSASGQASSQGMVGPRAKAMDESNSNQPIKRKSGGSQRTEKARREGWFPRTVRRGLDGKKRPLEKWFQ